LEQNIFSMAGWPFHALIAKTTGSQMTLVFSTDAHVID
jgi:hypothetical protein